MWGVVYRKWNGTNVVSCIPEVEWYKCGELYTGSGMVQMFQFSRACGIPQIIFVFHKC
jgi:hypothetical protein